MSENEQQPADERQRPPECELAPLDRRPHEDAPHAEDRRDDAPRLPSRAEILFKLDQMPGLVAVGLLPPARSNSMRGIYSTILANLDDSSRNGTAVADEDLLKVLRQQPELLKILKPFLTPEQVALIIREMPHDP